MKDDEVAVGEVVLRSEGVGRVDQSAYDEGGGAQRGDRSPLTETQVRRPLCDTEQEHQGIHRQQIAGEQSAAEYGEGDPVRGQNYEDCGKGLRPQTRTVRQPGEEHRGQSTGHRTNMFMCMVR